MESERVSQNCARERGRATAQNLQEFRARLVPDIPEVLRGRATAQNLQEFLSPTGARLVKEAEKQTIRDATPQHKNTE